MYQPLAGFDVLNSPDNIIVALRPSRTISLHSNRPKCDGDSKNGDWESK
jgi:hypothetical protein